LGICVTLILAQSLLLSWIVPRYLTHVIEQLLGHTVSVGRVHWYAPLGVAVDDLRSIDGWPESGFHADRVIIKPAWVSWKHRTLWLDAVEIEQLWFRVSRTLEGSTLWPLESLDARAPATTTEPTPAVSAPRPASAWQIIVRTLSVVDGVIEFSDQQLARPFHGIVHHISLVAGPLALPAMNQRTNLAIRGQLVGHGGHAAPLYCSGWTNAIAGDLQASCQLEPIALAAFEPYYPQGSTQVRVYQARLGATSEWSARQSALTGRMQLTIDNLSEGDISVRGSTLVDIRRIAAGSPPVLSGEMKVTGPLDDPSQWRFELVPGNEIVQRLIKPLLNRGREIVQLRLGRQTIKVGITHATEAVMTGIEEASKQVEESLELLVAPAELITPPQEPVTPSASTPAETTEPSPEAVSEPSVTPSDGTGTPAPPALPPADNPPAPSSPSPG
jgi:hypothetical protein